MGIHTVHQFEEPDDIGVVIEGVKVLNNVRSATMAFIMLFGLIYALDLSFPDNLKYTFEFRPENHHESGWTQAQHQKYSS